MTLGAAATVTNDENMLRTPFPEIPHGKPSTPRMAREIPQQGHTVVIPALTAKREQLRGVTRK
ncbi:MAG: hypothetical protein BHV70_06535 [Bacteroidales bacterium 55_9]|nr:MAG: hypothetical protein BHV70_06535 [Bacteroidales bacterium 55_9]